MNQIPNQSHHRKIHISIHNIERVIVNHIVKIEIFAVLVITQTSSSLFSESQFLSANAIILEFIILEKNKVIIIAIIAKRIFISISILKNHISIFVFSVACSNSFSHFQAANIVLDVNIKIINQ